MKPWGVSTDTTFVQIYDLYTDGYSPRLISAKLNLPETVVRGTIKSPTFQQDLQLKLDDLEYEQLTTPRGRVNKLQDLALDRMTDEITNPRSRKGFEASQDILDRGNLVPRRHRVDHVEIVIGAGELAVLAKVLREVGGDNGHALAEAVDAQLEPPDAIPDHLPGQEQST